MVAGPAHRRGISFDEGLVQKVVDDVDIEVRRTLGGLDPNFGGRRIVVLNRIRQQIDEHLT